MLILRALRRLLQFYRFLYPAEQPTRWRGKQPDSYTESQVIALGRGAGPLLGIALAHHDVDIATLACEMVDDPHHLHIIAICQEANVVARMSAVRRSRDNQDLMVEIAIRDDDAALAQLASHLVESPSHIAKLYDSKYETVRLTALMKEKNAKSLERLLHDPSPRIRKHATERLRTIYAN